MVPESGSKAVALCFPFIFYLMLFFNIHKMSCMHLLQSDSANESTENERAFNIIAANGPLRRWGVRGGAWPVDRHASVSRGICKPLVNVRFAGRVLTHRH